MQKSMLNAYECINIHYPDWSTTIDYDLPILCSYTIQLVMDNFDLLLVLFLLPIKF